MRNLDRLIQDNKITIFENQRLSEPLIEINNQMMLITDYIFNYHSYKDTEINIQSHFNGDWFSVRINRHIQRLKDNEMHDLEVNSFDMKIKLKPLEILDEILDDLNTQYNASQTGTLLNVLDDYITYIDFLIDRELDDYHAQKELLFIEKDDGLNVTDYHRLKVDHNQLKRENNELIDISWFVDVVGIYVNELKRLENINTQIF